MSEANETPVPPWKYLVRREHPWRKQLYLKSRNMTARQLVGGIYINMLTAAEAARNYDLPVEAVREAMDYAAQNQELLRAEAEYERKLLEQEGHLQ